MQQLRDVLQKEIGIRLPDAAGDVSSAEIRCHARAPALTTSRPHVREEVKPPRPVTRISRASKSDAREPPAEVALEIRHPAGVRRVRRARRRARFWVQVRQSGFLCRQGQKRYQRTIELDATRGRIVDRNGSMLAVSLATYEIWATPKLIDAAASRRSRACSRCRSRSCAGVWPATSAFVLLKRQVDADTASRIDKLGLAGITQIADSKRFYPEGESAAHVVGFTDIEDNGQEGVELAANAQLNGEAGQREVIRDRLGRAVSDTRAARARAKRRDDPTDHRPPHPATRLRAIEGGDCEAQRGSRQRGGAGCAQRRDPRARQLPELRSERPHSPERPATAQPRAWSIRSSRARRSSRVVVALSMDKGKVGPQTLIDTSPGWYRIGPAVIHDTSNHGVMTVAEAVQKSSNIALAKLALNLPAETIWNKYQEYGLGRAPELTFPGAAAGKVRPYKRWRPIEQATMAYGYGLSAVTAADRAGVHRLCRRRHAASGALAADRRGGLGWAVLRQRGQATQHGRCTARRGAQHAVTTPATARAIRTMLEMATGPGGTGRAAAVEGYRVGGKTGTARKQIGASYAKNRYRALFVGMAPMSDPRVIVAVMIDDPAGRAFYGGTVAGPVFRRGDRRALQLLGVPPDA